MRKKQSSIWIVQADHLSGESLGSVIETLLDFGAKNAHIIPTVTKKNRPGHIIFIDITNAMAQEKIEKYLVEDLGIYGHHRIITEHHYAVTQVIERPVMVKTPEGEINLSVKLKSTNSADEGGFPRIEHDSLVAIQRELKSACDAAMSVREIASVVESSVRQGLDEVLIVINGSHRKTHAKGEA